MRIPVVSATGAGPTELAAFDAALVAAGVADRNLIYLSSVLPPASEVVQVPTIVDCPGIWGDRLYCVKAAAVTSTPGRTVAAGIGWVQDNSGRGLLVEHHADDPDQLADLIHSSLDGLLKNRANADLPHRGMVTAAASCRTYTGPVCALTIAVFEHQPWTRR